MGRKRSNAPRESVGVLCRAFAAGNCERGSSCRFWHNREAPAAPDIGGICWEYKKLGCCTREMKDGFCGYAHERDSDPLVPPTPGTSTWASHAHRTPASTERALPAQVQYIHPKTWDSTEYGMPEARTRQPVATAVPAASRTSKSSVGVRASASTAQAQYTTAATRYSDDGRPRASTTSTAKSSSVSKRPKAIRTLQPVPCCAHGYPKDSYCSSCRYARYQKEAESTQDESSAWPLIGVVAALAFVAYRFFK